MKHVKVTFRGLEPREALVASVHGWVRTIREGLPPSSRVGADVLIHRCSPQWGSWTTVRVTISVDGRETLESARSQEPQTAVEDSFAALGRSLRAGADALATTATRLNRGELWGPEGTF